MRQGRKSEIKMGFLYAMEGLEECTDTKEKDSWLGLFQVTLDELEDYENIQIQAMFDIDSNDIEEIEKLSKLAEKVKESSVSNREDIIDRNNMIERAEKVYEKL